MTSHEFARQLLAMEDLPIFHFDPSLAGYADERDTSTSTPQAEIVEIPAEGERCNDPDQVDRFITINGTENQDYEKDREITIAVRVLNEAFTADPVATAALIDCGVPCNQQMLDHPTIQCGPGQIGPLGLINGIVDRICGQRVAAMFSDETPQSLTGFTVYQPPS